MSRKKPKRPKTFEDRVSPTDALDALLRDRYHGAVNIRGIRFQLRYSVARAIELAATAQQLHGPADPILHFEGLEDVDIEGSPSLAGLEVHSAFFRELIQVKTAAEPWGWHKLREPFIGFLEILRTRNEDAQLRLVVNFPLRGDIDRLARYADLKSADQTDIRSKLRKLCQKIGGAPAEADRLLERLAIQHIAEDQIKSKIRRDLAELTGTTDVAALDAYELMLAGRALGWAADRARVRPREIGDLVVGARDGFARAEHFSAVSRRLVGSVAVDPDAQPDDFFQGKRARPGHVVAGLDVRRPKWLHRIEEAFTRTPVVVIRAPSGHGKSTLAYRYGFEQWPRGDVILLRSLDSAEEVGAVEDYLRFRADLGLPIRVIVDADYRTRFWPRIITSVASLGGRALVTVRFEDWHRFAIDALTRREIIEPILDREEAGLIFAEFFQRGHIHPAVDSADWAYERLRPPHLLLEFVYLITHGQMLEDRLRDQIRDIRRLGVCPSKAA